MVSDLSSLRHPPGSFATTLGPVTARIRRLLAKINKSLMDMSHSGSRNINRVSMALEKIYRGVLPSDLDNGLGSSLDEISAVARDLSYLRR